VIIGIGAIAVDTVLVTAGHWNEGKGRILQRRLRMGGNVRNAIVAAAALGGQVAYLGCLSADEQWAGVASDLTDHGIDLRFVEWNDGAAPIQSTIVVTADAERFIAFDDSVLQTTPLPSAGTVQQALEVATVLLVDASTAPPGTLGVLDEARSRRIPIVVDAERFLPGGSVVEQILSRADHIILPRHFAHSLTSPSLEISDLPTHVHAALGTQPGIVVVVTDGTNGVVVCTQTEGSPVVEHLSAFEIQAIDTVGCGDVFHGAYAVAMDAGQQLGDRLRFASAAAASVAALTQDRDRVPDLQVMSVLLGGPGQRSVDPSGART